MMSDEEEIVMTKADVRTMNWGKPKHKKINMFEWRDRKKKRLKDAGKSYVRVRNTKKYKKGDMVPAMVPPSGEKVCRCLTKTGCNLEPEEYVTIFRKFYALNSSQQNLYFSENIDREIPGPATANSADGPISGDLVPKKRGPYSSYTYWAKLSGARHQMCERTFCHTLGVTDNRLRTIKNKFKLGLTNFNDRRGRTKGVHPNLIPEEIKEAVRVHIKSFPTRVSHYSRKDAGPERRYLDAGLSVARMHKTFNDQRLGQGNPGCKIDTYRDIFNSDFDLRFGNPKNDTCGYCDEKYAAISRETSQIRKAKLQQEHTDHLILAEEARRCHAVDSHNPENGVFSITTDMEKVLFVPQLTCGEEYFKRTLSTYNLGIHETGTTNAFMFTWNQTIAKTSAQDVISCIWKYISRKFNVLLTHEQRCFIIWSDRCVGQYNNIYMVLFLKFLVDKKYFTRVNHKFFTTGHSFMQCDRDFGLVEARFQNLLPIVPSDVDEVIRSARLENPFIVTGLEQNDFLSFNDLASEVSIHKEFQVTKYLWFRYNSEDPNIVSFKRKHSDVAWTKFKLLRRLSRSTPLTGHSFESLTLPPSNSQLIEIPEAKALDLRSLMTKIPDNDKYEYYNNLTKFVSKS